MNVKLILWLVAGVALVGFGLHYRGLHATISGQAAQIDTLQDTVIECESDKKLTEDVNGNNATQIRALNNQLAALKRVRDNPRCIPVSR